MAASRKQNVAAQKAARQKKMAIGGGVLLLVVLFIQVPRLMKQLKGSSAAAAAPVVAPTPVAPAPGSVAVPSGTPISTGGNKLVSFESFETKDPFVQQVSATSGTASSSQTAAALKKISSSTTAKSSTTSSSSSSTTSFKTDASGGTKTFSRSTTAVLTVNGTQQTVKASKTFPKSDPVFLLVSVGSSSVEIAIADGSFKSGGKTITLSVGKPVTLLNTADDKRYKLVLVSTAS